MTSLKKNPKAVSITIQISAVIQEFYNPSAADCIQKHKLLCAKQLEGYMAVTAQ